MNICSLLEMVAAAGDERGAVTDGESTHSAADILKAAEGVAGWLQSRDFSAAIYLGENTVELPVVLFAAAWVGIPFIPLNYRLSEEQLRGLASRHPGAAVFGSEAGRLSSLPELTTVPAESTMLGLSGPAAPPRWAEDEDAPAVYLYTSGTTGDPKAVILRHRHLTSYVLGVTEYSSAEPDSATLVTVPPYHIAGIANLLSNLYAGRRIVYLARFTAEDWLRAAHDHGITNAMVVPTMLARIVSHLETTDTSAPPTLTALAYGGAKTPRAVIERALRLLPEVAFVNAYGLTETSSTIALLGPDDHRAARDGNPAALKRLESVGKILDSVEIGVFDVDGNPLPPDEIGEIKVRGRQISGEYVGRSALDENGWFATRDLGWVDSEGYLYIQGRGDDTIIRGGENIAPAEIEAVLLGHPAIADVGVVGIPDEEWGQTIAAAVVFHDEAVAVDDLLAWSLAQLRTSKAPTHIRIVEELPYSDTGKLVRRELVSLFTDALPAEQPTGN